MRSTKRNIYYATTHYYRYLRNATALLNYVGNRFSFSRIATENVCTVLIILTFMHMHYYNMNLKWLSWRETQYIGCMDEWNERETKPKNNENNAVEKFFSTYVCTANSAVHLYCLLLPQTALTLEFRRWIKLIRIFGFLLYMPIRYFYFFETSSLALLVCRIQNVMKINWKKETNKNSFTLTLTFLGLDYHDIW